MPTSYFNSPVAAHDLRPVEKSMTCRTHRICDPQDTLDWLMPKLSPMGITRLSDITGLDRIGIPIAQAVRPLAVIVRQSGQGPDPDGIAGLCRHGGRGNLARRIPCG